MAHAFVQFFCVPCKGKQQLVFLKHLDFEAMCLNVSFEIKNISVFFDFPNQHFPLDHFLCKCVWLSFWTTAPGALDDFLFTQVRIMGEPLE